MLGRFARSARVKFADSGRMTAIQKLRPVTLTENARSLSKERRRRKPEQRRDVASRGCFDKGV